METALCNDGPYYNQPRLESASNYPEPYLTSLVEAANVTSDLPHGESDVPQRDVENSPDLNEPASTLRPQPSSVSPSVSRKRKRRQEDREADGNNALTRMEYSPTNLSSEASPHEALKSAVALFRAPSLSSRKTTRPPMSKLYLSLELPPDSFLHLQAAAKTYMLDSSHPERFEAVGQRGKGDPVGIVKLNLYNCVKSFLVDEGHGMRYFAAGMLGDAGVARTMVWPDDEAKIVAAVTPLLRRMVTNERQRKYAVEARSKPSANWVDSQDQDEACQSQAQDNSSDTLILEIRILKNPGQTLIASCDMPAEYTTGCESLFTSILNIAGASNPDDITMSVFLPEGLTQIRGDVELLEALSIARNTSWLGGKVIVLLEVD